MRTHTVRNLLTNPHGRNTRSGWTFAMAAGGTTFEYSEIANDPDLGKCLEVTIHPSVALDFCFITLTNGGTWPVVKPYGVAHFRLPFKIVSAAVTPTLRVKFEYAFIPPAILSTSQDLILKTFAQGDVEEVEVFEMVPRDTYALRPYIRLTAGSADPITFRIKAQLSQPWGDVPEFCPQADGDFSGTVDASVSSRQVSANLPAIFGYNDLSYSHLDDAFDVPVQDQSLSLADNATINKQLGAGVIRSWAGWAKASAVAPLDHYLRREWFEYCRQSGLKFIPTVGSPHPWMGTGLQDLSAAEMTEVASYAAALVDEFGDVILAVEAPNEPNLSGSWNNGVPQPAVYTDLLEAIYTAVKAVDPDMPVLGGCLARANNNVTSGDPQFIQLSVYNFLDQMLTAGAAAFMDAVSIHPYPYAASTGVGQAGAPAAFSKGAGMWGNIKQARDAMAAHNVSLPLWVTEVGYIAALGNTVVSGRQAELVQAQMVALMRGALSRQDDIDAVFIHDLWNAPDPSFAVVNWPSRTFRPAAEVMA